MFTLHLLVFQSPTAVKKVSISIPYLLESGLDLAFSMHMDLGKFFLLLLLVSRVGVAAELECIVVSGLEKDHNGAFANNKFLTDESTGKSSAKFGNKDCRVFDDWSEMTTYVLASQSKKPLFIYQGAHGITGGGAVCNRGRVSGKAILNSLELMARDRKIGVWLDSCYSGDLIYEKLRKDERNPDAPHIQNLCLATASLPNHLMFTQGEGTALANTNLSYDLEFLFRLYGKGLISSADWSKSGIVEYMESRSHQAAVKALTRLTENSRYCGNEDQISFANALVMGDSDCNRAQLNEILPNLNHDYLAGVLKPGANFLVQSEISEEFLLAARRSILSQRDKLYDELTKQVVQPIDLEYGIAALEKIKQWSKDNWKAIPQVCYENLIAFFKKEALNFDGSEKPILSLYGGMDKALRAIPACSHLSLNRYLVGIPYAGNDLDESRAGAFPTEVYLSMALSKFQEIAWFHDFSRRLEDLDNSKDDGKSGAVILDRILGLNHYYEQYACFGHEQSLGRGRGRFIDEGNGLDGKTNPLSEKTFSEFVEGTTGPIPIRVLKAYNDGTLRASTRSTHPLDVKRRKACQDFQWEKVPR